MVAHPAAACSEEAIAVFEQIAINNDEGHPQHLLNELLDKGLIEGNQIALLVHPVKYKTRYLVPIHLHYQWCTWCSEQPGLDDEELG